MRETQNEVWGGLRWLGRKVASDSLAEEGTRLVPCREALGMGGKSGWGQMVGVCRAKQRAPVFRDLATLRCHGDRPPGSFFVDNLVS